MVQLLVALLLVLSYVAVALLSNIKDEPASYRTLYFVDWNFKKPKDWATLPPNEVENVGIILRLFYLQKAVFRVAALKVSKISTRPL